MTKVITYGTFDLFHIGHLNILKRARELGDYLCVGVSTDEFNALKNKKCVYPYRERAEIVGAIRFVDEVIPESNWEQKAADIRDHQIDKRHGGWYESVNPDGSAIPGRSKATIWKAAYHNVRALLTVTQRLRRLAGRTPRAAH